MLLLAFFIVLVFLLRLLRNFCVFCVRPRIAAPSKGMDSRLRGNDGGGFAPSGLCLCFIRKSQTSSSHAGYKHFSPRNPHKCCFSPFSLFWCFFCVFCVTFASFAFAPVFLCVLLPYSPLYAAAYSTVSGAWSLNFCVL